MTMTTLAQALQWLPGARLVGDGDLAFARVHSDSRSLQAGDLFVALQGERFDANDFIAPALAQGAVAALAHTGRIPSNCHGIEVSNTRQALIDLASGWRRQFQLPVVAVTGSNGKTTVTQMIAAIFRAAAGDAALATLGNLNNDIGVPLTVLRLRASHRLAVIELGMNHPGEIAQLAPIAQPTVALVNNAQREHQEFMATVQAVAEENGAVISALPTNGVAVFPADDAFTPLWLNMAGRRAHLTFATAAPTDVPSDVHLLSAEWQQGAWQVTVTTPAGPVAYSLYIAGRHNVRNSMAALCCALAAGVSLQHIAAGLSEFTPVKGRSRALSLRLAGRDLTLVDDTYNANPDSVRAAIDVLAELPGPGLLVLGDMGEVGSEGPKFHAEVGAYAKERGVAKLFTLGDQAAQAATSFGAGQHFTDIAALNQAVLAALPDCASVVVKGSRFMKMERVVEAVTTQLQPTAQKASHAA